jgi:cysteine desulfurase
MKSTLRRCYSSHHPLALAMIYLDNAATTRLDPEVLEAMLPWLREDFGNASALYQLARRARVAVEEARATIAELIGAEPAEVFY